MSSDDVAAIIDSALPLRALAAHSSRDYEPLMSAIGDARIVLLGEATHGTTEFYQARAAITQRLVAEKGFSVVLVEAEWPAAYRLNTWLHDASSSADDAAAKNALQGFKDYPKWMWRNEEIARLSVALKQHNARCQEAERERDAAASAREEFIAAGATEEQMQQAGIATRAEVEAAAAACSGRRPCGFYGMDTYSVQASAQAVLEFLDCVDPDFAPIARSHYAPLLDPPPSKDDDAEGGEGGEGSEGGRDTMKTYGRRVVAGDLKHRAEEIPANLISVLGVVQRLARESAEAAFLFSSAELLSAEQNAEVVVNGEAYFRGMYQELSNVATWNLRDQHMVTTALRMDEYLTAQHGEPPKTVIWAHNSHIGDARATEMGTHQEWNVGQMCRTTFGTNNTFLVGFGTYEGTVTASREWGGSAQTFDLSPAEEGSHSDLMHCALPAIRDRLGEAQLNTYLLLLKEQDGSMDEKQKALRAALGAPRRQRAVGVRYRKDTEAASHYVKASLTAQFDAWVHVDHSTALIPLGS